MPKVTEDQEKLFEELDKKLLEAVRDGVDIVVDRKEGKERVKAVVRIQAPAAYLECARKRLHDLGLDRAENETDNTSELQKLLKDAPENVLDLPEITDEPDIGQDPYAKAAGK